MRTLTIKLLRDLRRLWPQALAIALVMAAGVATLILGIGAYDSLSTTRQRYYDENRFGDLFVSVARAPLSLRRDIMGLNGVSVVDTRIEKIAIADVSGMSEPAAVLLVSLPESGEQLLNRIYLRSGRLPEADDEALSSTAFAQAHHLREGDQLRVLINGRLRSIRISGTGLSPEFIYTLGPGALMPDERRFGIIWMPERVLAPAYDLDGAFNSLSVRLTQGAVADVVISDIDKLLERFGGRGAYGRKDQQSNAFLDAELQQLQSMSRILPPIFLLVSAFLMHMTLSRLIMLEREQIGLLRAMGYTSLAIMRHYAGFVTLIALAGIALGIAAGTWLGVELTQLYARFFSFPFLVFTRDPAVYGIAAITTYAAAIVGAIGAVRGVARLSPAVAMAPPAPERYRKFLPEWLNLSACLRQSSIIILRHLAHWPARTLGGVFGISLSVAILVGSLWSFGSIEHMIDVTFHRSDRQDAAITFSNPRPRNALFDVAHLPGVMRAEPFRVVAVKMAHGAAERRVSLLGREGGATLTQLLDGNLQKLAMPDSGVVLSSALADILRLRTGDSVEVEVLEGSRPIRTLPVSAIVSGAIGLTAFVDIGVLNRMLDEEPLISGVDVMLDMSKTDSLFSALKAMPAASFLSLQYVAVKRFRETMGQNVTIMISVYATLASIIAIGVVYNFARISLSEQAREMASLRVLGFTRSEVSALLLGELLVIVIAAQPLGWGLGYLFAALMTEGFRSELYRVPLIVKHDVYAWASLIVFVAAAASALLVRRRIDQLNMVEVLKTRE